jgi:spoIIIJ-associated protein
VSEAAGTHTVEATGETVGEAKWSALRELERLYPGLDKAAVRFHVVSEGERGLLGVGYAPARVVASVPEEAAEPAPVGGSGDAAEDEGDPVRARVRELLERLTRGIGVQCRIELYEEEGGVLRAVCSGRDLGLLIGKHGQTIDAIQYLVNAIVARQAEERREIVVDAAGYRARRQASLEALAVRFAERALSSGDEVGLDPMTAVERKVVHVRLKEFAGVETRSEGTEPNRYVVIAPAAPAARPRERTGGGGSGEPGGSPDSPE